MTKKRHWSSTPRGKAHMRKMRRASVLKRKAQASDVHTATQASPEQLGYAFGYVQSFLHHFARSASVSESALAKRVGALLQRA